LGGTLIGRWSGEFVAVIKEDGFMAMSKSQIQAELAERTGLTKKQVKQFLDEQAAQAYRQAGEGYSIDGIGKLVLVDRKARQGRNPATGETIQIPAKRVVKFRIAKICKDSVL
jgi:DNA-binding protein HU-beta